jgi:hypothetical protein
MFLQCNWFVERVGIMIAREERIMARSMILTIVACGLLTAGAFGQNREDKVRNDKKKVEAEGYWIYNDLPKAIAQAKEKNRPIVAVLRCIPCEECVKLDDEIIDADEQLKKLLDQYVRVRIVSTNGLDLSLFQFDTDQSFAVFLLNADGTIYGRFGTRSHRTEWIGDVSVEGLAKALKGALDLHANFPANKASLAGKRGPAPEYPSPEKYPMLKGRYKSTIDYQGKVVPSCIHCHQVGEAIRESAMQKHSALPEEILFPFPHPRTVGLTFDPKEMATVVSVDPRSPAAEAGFKAGDMVQDLSGQPLVSIADVQWVLHRTPAAGGEIKANLIRSGQSMKVTLKLESGWRQKDNISWRASTWALRRKAFGGMLLVDLPQGERPKLPENATALRVQHVGQYAPHDVAKRAGFQKGDVLLSFDGRSDLLRESDLLAYSLWKKKPGDKVAVTILRNGQRRTLTLTIPN